MLVDIPGKGKVELDLPEDITQEELDALTPEINAKVASIEPEQEEKQPEETAQPTAKDFGVDTWENYQAQTNFDKQDFEKKKELFDTWRGKTIQALEPTGALDTSIGRKRLTEQFDQISKVYDLGRKDRNPLEKYVVDIPRLWKSGVYGWKQFQLSEATEDLEKAKASGNKEEAQKQAENIKKLQEEISSLPQPQENVGDIFLSKSVLPNVQSALVEQLSMLVPKMVTNADAVVGQVAAGAGAGASIGAFGEGVGAIPGAIQGAKLGLRTGMATAVGKSSYELEYSGQLLGLLSGEVQKDIRQKNIQRAKNGQPLLKDPTPGFDGINVNNPEELLAAMDNQKLMDQIRQSANEKGITVGVTDGLIALITGAMEHKFAASNAARGLRGVSKLRKFSQTGALFLNEVAGGTGGEALSQKLAFGDVYDPNAVAMEGALEIGGAMPVIAAAKGSSRFDAVSERLKNYAPQTAMALAMQDFRRGSNLMGKLYGEQQELGRLPFTFDRESFDSLHSGLNDEEKQSSFNKATKLASIALREAYNVLGLNPDKPLNIRFSDSDKTFSFDASQENTVSINLDRLREDLSAIDSKASQEKGNTSQQAEKRRQTYVVSALAEEIIHDLDLSKSRRDLYQRAIEKGEVDPKTKSFEDWRKEFGERGASQMTDKEKDEVRREYGDPNLDGDKLYSEFVRRLIQKKKIGITTEDTWQTRKDIKEQNKDTNVLEQTLLTARDYWQRAQRGLSKNSPVVKEHLKAINSLLDEKQKVESKMAKAAKTTAANTSATAPEEKAQTGEETVVETGENTQASVPETEQPKPSAESATPVPATQPAQTKSVAKATKLVSKPKVNPASLKRWQARGKYGSVRLVFPDQSSADAYDAGRRRDGKNRQRDSATLTKYSTVSQDLERRGVVPKGKSATLLGEYRQFIRKSIVEAEEGSDVKILSFEEFLKTKNPVETVKLAQPDDTKATQAVKNLEKRGWEKIGGPFLQKTYPEGKVTLEVKPWQGNVRLSNIETEKQARGKGLGTKALRELTDSADEAGVAIEGDVKPSDNEGLNESKLYDWYGKQGFKRQPYTAQPDKMSNRIVRSPKEVSATEQKPSTTVKSAPTEVVEPSLSIPEDEETLGAAQITRTPRGQEKARAQYFSSVDPTHNLKEGEQVNPNADKILDSLINDPEIVDEAIKFFSGYIRNNPIFKIELEQMGIKTPSEVANEAMLAIMAASRENSFPENGTKQEQKTAIFRTIKNKLTKLITPELEEKISGRQQATPEQIAEESDPEMEQEAEVEIAKAKEQVEESEKGVADEEEIPESAPTMAESERVAAINPETGEARTARTADWGDTLGRNLPDTIESQEVPEFSDKAYDENGEAVVSVDPDILSRASAENVQSIGQILRRIIDEAPFSSFDKEMFAEIWNGNAEVQFNPYTNQIEVKSIETEKDRASGRAVPAGERKKRQRSRERIAKWMTETLRPRMIKELGDLRFANLSPKMIKKLGLNRYRLGDVLGAAKITSDAKNIEKALERLPDWEPYWLGPSGEVIPVESAVVRMEGMEGGDSHAGEMLRWLQENQPEKYKELQQKYGYGLGKNINNEMFTQGWLRLTNDGNNLMVEGKPGRDQVNLLVQKAISMELGVVHDRWPAKSKVLFKPLSGKEISNVVNEMDIFGAAKVSVAAFRDKSYRSLAGVERSSETRLAKRGQNIIKLASAFGFKISDPTKSAGGWYNPEIGAQLEPSVMFTLEEGNAEQLAALLATHPFATPEVQRAVYIFDTDVTNPTDTEHEIVFKDRQGLNKFVANAQKLGFGDGFGIDLSTNTLYLGVQGTNEEANQNIAKFFESYKDYIKEARSELGQVKILDQSNYSELLGQLGNKIQDIENDFSKGLAAYHIGASRTALRRGEIGTETSPQTYRKIRGWHKSQASKRLLRQARGLAPMAIENLWVPVRKDFGRKIAEAYENLPDFDPSPEVEKAYKALADEVEKQWKYAKETMGVKFEPWNEEGQPYKNSAEMQKDVRENNHLFYFTGGEAHPYLGTRDESGVSLNDKLRAIHDLFGHATEGYGFGPTGEENAWIKHSQMFSREAQKALTTETRGQNSWFNFGPHRFTLLGADLKAEKGTAPYAKQKVALLPEEFRNWKTEEVLGELDKRAIMELATGYPKKMTPEEKRNYYESLPAKNKLKSSGVMEDDQAYEAEIEKERQRRLSDLAPWEEAELSARMKTLAPDELGAAKISETPSTEFMKSVAGFNFALRRMQGAKKLVFARKVEGEKYWQDVHNKNRNLADVVSDLSTFENETEVLDFWNKLLSANDNSGNESFNSNLIKLLNTSTEGKDKILASTASLFKVPMIKTANGESLVLAPFVGGNVGIMESNGKISYVSLSEIVPDEGYLTVFGLDADKFASGKIPVLPKVGSAERVMFDENLNNLRSATNKSSKELRTSATEVSKYVPAQDVVGMLRNKEGFSERKAKDIVYGNVYHAAKINPIDESEMDLVEIGAIPFDAERPTSGLLTAKGALIEGNSFEDIDSMELFSKKELSKFRKSWMQLRVDENKLVASTGGKPTDEQELALAKVVTFAKKPVFLNGKIFDHKTAIRKQAFNDAFAERIKQVYLQNDAVVDEFGNVRTETLETPDFRKKNYNLFKQIESLKNSGKAFDYTMEQVLEMMKDKKFEPNFEALRMAFKGNSVPTAMAILTHEIFPGMPQAAREYIASRLPYFLSRDPSSEALNLVVKLKDFKDWFGGSKATRPDGTPAVHYYVSNSDIREPNTMSKNGGALTYSADLLRTPETTEALKQEYKEDGRPRMAIPVFVRAENPLVVQNTPEVFLDSSVMVKDSIAPMLAEAISKQTGESLPDVTAKIKELVGQIEEQSYKHLTNPQAFANTYFQGVLKGFGFDSIEIGSPLNNDKGQQSKFVVFDPNQLKLANGLNTDFSASPDVLGAARIEGFKYQPEDNNRFDLSKVPFLPRFAKELLGKYVTNADKILGYRRFWQDRFIDLKRIQESIEKFTGEPLPDTLNAYQLEELYHGKVGARLTDFNENVAEPILKMLRDSGISMAEIEEFMYALHAKERNERIRLINPIPDEPYAPGPDASPEEVAKYEKAKRNKAYIEALHEKGSGMSDAEADDIISKYRMDDRAEKFEEARQMIRQMIDGSLKQKLEEGLISQPLFDALTERYKDYVPLKGIPGATAEEVATSGQATGKGFNIRGDEVKPTLGRLSRAENILAYAMNSAAAGIVRAEKNVIGNAIYELVRLFPDSDLWEIAQPGTIRRLVTRKNPETGEVFQYARDFIDPTWMNQPDIFATKINGETKFVRIKNPDLIRNLKNGGLNSEHWSSKVISGLASFMRLLSLTRTGLSPEFIFTNPIRDLQTAAMNLSEEQYKDLASRVLKSVVSLKPLRTSIAEEFNPGSTSDEWGDSYRAFLKNGGKLIGWMTSDIETQIKDVKEAVDGQEPTKVKRYFNAAADWIEKANGGVENATRLAVFHHARELGATDQQAAAIARNATVNFTKKGEAGPVFNSLYLFFNASLQGSARLVQAMAKSPKVRKLATGAVISGALTSMFNEAAGGEDDDGETFWSKVPEFKKRTNIIIMLPNTRGRYIALPLPYGYNVFWHTGNILSDFALGKKGNGSTAVRMMETVMESFNPIGGAKNLLSSITPTIFQPITDIYLNQDWAGRPIVPSDFPGDPSPTPASEKYFNSVTPMFKHLTSFLNEISGGNEIREGSLSMSPEYLDYFASYLTGAVGSSILRIASLPEKILDPNESLGLNDIPILRRFVGEQPSYADYERFASIKQASYTAVEEQKMFSRKGDAQGETDARAKYAPELEVYPIVRSASGQLQKVKQQIKALQKTAENTGEDNSAQIKQLKERQKEIIMNVSKAYKDATDRAK